MSADDPQRPVEVNGRSLLARMSTYRASLTRRQMLLALVGIVGAAVVAVLAVLAWYLIFRQPITQLPGLSATVPPSYSFSVDNLNRPLGVAVDESNERIYVTQSGGDRQVRVLDLQGRVIDSLPVPPDAGLHMPVYVAVNPKTQAVYVTDRGTNKLYMYDAEGAYSGTLKPHGETLWGPLAVATDAAGLIYVADAGTSDQFVWVLTEEGEVVRTIGRDAGISFANGIAVHEDGRVFVSDSNHGRVLAFSPEGELLGTLARGEAEAPMGLPRGLAVGPGARLYIVDTTNAIVRIYRTGDEIPTFGALFGELGAGGGQFLYPNGIAADEHGRIYVTDRENNRLQVWVNR